MQIKCPACGAVASLDLLLAAEDGASEVIKIAAEMPPELWRIIVQYLALFRPKKTKLSFSRMASLLGELHPMIQNGQLERAGKLFHVPLKCWIAGIEHMLIQRDRLTLPLKTHGYLYEVLIGLDAKSIKDIEKPKTEKKPPEHIAPVIAEETPKDLMSKDEARAVWQKLVRKTNVSPTQNTDIDHEAKRQAAIDALERQATQK